MTTIDVSKIQDLINSRKKSLEDAGKALLLGKNLTLDTLKGFTDMIFDFLNITSQTDASFFKKKFNEFYSQIMRPLPEGELAAAGINKLSHGKFGLLTTSILLNEQSGDFIHAAIKNGTNILTKSLSDFSGNLDELTSTFLQHLSELPGYITEIKNNPDLILKNIINDKSQEIVDKSNNLYSNVLRLYSILTQHNDYSSGFVSMLYNDTKELSDLLKGISGIKDIPASVSGISNLFSTTRDLWTKGTNLFNKVNNFKDIDTRIVNGIDYKSLLDSHFLEILNNTRQIVKYCLNLPNLVDQNGNALTSALQEIQSLILFLQGNLGSMAQKNLKTSLFVPGQNRDMLDTLMSDISSLTQPVNELNNIKNDCQAVIDLTQKLIQGVLPPDNAVSTLTSRISNNRGIVSGFISDVISIFDNYTPVIGELAETAFNALKATAPTPLNSLGLGDTERFVQALNDPRALTEIGPAMIELSNILNSSTNLTAVQASTINELIDYVNKEHTREIITTYINDSDLQKAIALSGIKQYIETTLKPIQQTLDLFTTLF